jgi:predicted RNA-binding protein Jag
MELAPRPADVRRLQHDLIERQGLVSKSLGKEPSRRVKIYRSES